MDANQPVMAHANPVPRASRFVPESLSDALTWLGRQPTLLLLFVLALNALRFPYLGRVHDATLYSFQTLNHLSGGQFSNDLFFKYGSQDRFSLFSTIVSPLVGVAGFEATFLLLYLLSVALFYWSAIRLIRAIIRNDSAVTAAAILTAVSPLWFGGLEIFRANEAFFTPRLPACGLSLLALESVLTRKTVRAVACLTVALALHPLMAGPAMLVVFAYGAWALIEERSAAIKLAAITVAVGLGAAGILITGRFVPVLDDTWRAVIRQASPYNFPADWQLPDWLMVIASSTIVSAAAYVTRHQRALARLLGVSVAAGIVGLSLTWFASGSSHSLLFQIQPYRALWLLSVLLIPCSLLVAATLWNSHSNLRRLMAVFVCAYLLRTEGLDVQAQLTLAALPLAFLAVRLAVRGPRFADDVWRTVAFATAAAIVGVAAMSCLYLLIERERLVAQFDPIAYMRLWLAAPGALGWLAVACTAAWIMRRRSIAGPAAIAGLLSCFLIVHAAGALPSLHAYRQRFRARDTANLDFVKARLGPLNVGRRPFTIYMDWGQAGDVWLEARANAYFHLSQVVGVLFSRQTALEATRRAAIVAPFEKARYADDGYFNAEIVRLMVERLFPAGVGRASGETLKQLCADPLLDYAVLRESASPADIMSNGSIRIYDCRQLRSGPP